MIWCFWISDAGYGRDPRESIEVALDRLSNRELFAFISSHEEERAAVLRSVLTDRRRGAIETESLEWVNLNKADQARFLKSAKDKVATYLQSLQQKGELEELLEGSNEEETEAGGTAA